MYFFKNTREDEGLGCFFVDNKEKLYVYVQENYIIAYKTPPWPHTDC